MHEMDKALFTNWVLSKNLWKPFPADNYVCAIQRCTSDDNCIIRVIENAHF